MEEYVIEVPVCRVCLQSSLECVEIDTAMENESGSEHLQTYLDCLNLCTNLDIKLSNDLPKHICTICCAELRVASEFITKAKNSNEILLLQAEECRSEYVVYEFEPGTNEVPDNTVFMPIQGVEEMYEEEPDNFSDSNLKEESIEIEKNIAVKLEELNEEIYAIGSPEEINVETLLKDDDVTEEKEQIKCNICHTSFKDYSLLKDHGEQEHDLISFCCSMCYYRFNSKGALSEHMKRKHDGLYVTCDVCGSSVKQSFLKAHKRQVHRKTPYLCSACPRTFKTTTGLQIHSETHKENRQRNFECEQCHKKFLTERTYRVHIKTHWHRERFKCNLCNKEFLQKVNLRLHLQMHRGETMDCMYCDKKFVRKTDLAVHLRFHTGNFPYECQYCDKRFAIVSHLNYHQKRHQGYMYKCQICSKEFINMSGLRNHSFQHTAMPFNCILCKKGFPTRFKIKRHLKTVHHIEGEDFDQYVSTEKVIRDDAIQEAAEIEIIEEADGSQHTE